MGGVEQVGMPKGRAGAGGIGVEGVDTVGHGADKDDIVLDGVDGEIGHPERLGIDGAIDGARSRVCRNVAAETLDVVRAYSCEFTPSR